MKVCMEDSVLCSSGQPINCDIWLRVTQGLFNFSESPYDWDPVDDNNNEAFGYNAYYHYDS